MEFIIGNWFNLFLFFLLILIVSLVILKRVFKENYTAIVILAMAISLLSIYYLSSSQINFLSLSYTMFGIILTIIIPFTITFFFIYHSDLSSTFRKVFWFFFFGVIIILVQNSNIFQYQKIWISTGIVLFGLILIFFDNLIKKYISYFRNIRRY